MKSPSPGLEGQSVPHKYQALLLLVHPIPGTGGTCLWSHEKLQTCLSCGIHKFLRTHWRTVGAQQERYLRAELFSALRISNQLHQVQGLQQDQPQVLPRPSAVPIYRSRWGPLPVTAWRELCCALAYAPGLLSQRNCIASGGCGGHCKPRKRQLFPELTLF